VVFKVPGKSAGRKLMEEIWVAGNRFKAQEYVANKADTLCAQCSHWGHSEFQWSRCVAVCAVCTGNHQTEAHRCEVATCGAIRRACPHAELKCPNCGGNHLAKDARCRAKLNAIAIARGIRNGSHTPEARQPQEEAPEARQIGTVRQPRVSFSPQCPVSAATLAAFRDIPAADWSEDQDEVDAAMEVETLGMESSGTVPPVAE